MTGTKPSIAGNENTAAPDPHINNQTTLQQDANFNISGSGKADVFDAAKQFNIAGNRILSASGADNIFVGKNAGAASTAPGNSFFGAFSGTRNTTGLMNSFFGRDTGVSNLAGSYNSFFGSSSGSYTDMGDYNSFFGFETGKTNANGRYNTALGANADVSQPGLSYATAIGAEAVVSASNTIVLGRVGGVDGVTVPGKVTLEKLGGGGGPRLCHNAQKQIAACSSSLRYKTNVAAFSPGLNLIRRLQPIRFEWKESGMKDVGFGAEDVAAVEPLLVTYNDKGEIEGVKYEQLTTVLVNAVKEQQAQIEAQQRQLKQQQAVIDGLKKLLCGRDPGAEVCKQ